MRSFSSFGAFANHLSRAVEKMPYALHRGMSENAKRVAATARAKFGHYQGSAGPFPAWSHLKLDTIREKRRLGYADDINDNPLIRTGALRDSIRIRTSASGFIVGSDDEVMLYQELGTSRGVPPRPVFGPALYENIDFVLNNIGKHFITNISGGGR